MTEATNEKPTILQSPIPPLPRVTCPDEQHVVCPLHALDLVHSNLCVAHAAFEQQGRAANHAIHQEVVFDEVEHLIGHVQR